MEEGTRAALGDRRRRVSLSRFFVVQRGGCVPDIDYMERALQLARRAIGWCSPNPPVGAVVVQAGAIVGEGWTQAPGEAHAEIVALRQAGAAASGATLFVTLEPCSHHGRTPPCVDAIVAAGVDDR